MPKYNWSKPTFSVINEKRFDYITQFSEPVRPGLNMIKIHSKRRHEVPGPQAYNITKKWTHLTQSDDPKKGKWLKSARLTMTAEVMQNSKKEKLPAPCAYKPKHTTKIVGTIQTSEPQGLMLLEAKMRGKDTPGHKYKINHKLTES